MREQLTPAWIDNFWRRLFPGDIPTDFLVAEQLEGRYGVEGPQACPD